MNTLYVQLKQVKDTQIGERMEYAMSEKAQKRLFKEKRHVIKAKGIRNSFSAANFSKTIS